MMTGKAQKSRGSHLGGSESRGKWTWCSPSSPLPSSWSAWSSLLSKTTLKAPAQTQPEVCLPGDSNQEVEREGRYHRGAHRRRKQSDGPEVEKAEEKGRGGHCSDTY